MFHLISRPCVVYICAHLKLERNPPNGTIIHPRTPSLSSAPSIHLIQARTINADETNNYGAIEGMIFKSQTIRPSLSDKVSGE